MILEKRIPWTYFLGIIKWDLLAVGVFSTVVQYISSKFPGFTVPLSIGTFMGTAIALLLSFKLSQSYDRWWEARKIWGAIVNDSRSLVLQVQNFVKNQDEPLVKVIARRQIAWCYSLSQSLRKLDAKTVCAPFVSEEELKRIDHMKNFPVGLLNEHSKDLKTLHDKGVLNDFQEVQIDSTLVRLTASMGKAERIKNTFFPKTYRMTLHMFTYLFLVILSFSFNTMSDLIDVAILVAISIPFFLLEGIAFQIQDPFENRSTDTSTTAISRTIEENIKQLIGDTDLPVKPENNTFYDM